MDALSSLKPILTALVLPPVPWLLLMLLGGWIATRRRGLGRSLVLVGAALIWFSACSGVGRWLQSIALSVPPPLTAQQIAALKPTHVRPGPETAIVVLGGGRIPRAPETGTADLKPDSLERLRYGVFLARSTGLPLAFSGGVGWAQREDVGLSEAEIARRVSERDFQRPVQWIETTSRDTRENAMLSVRQLRAAGIRHIVLVTHVWHMPRAVRVFSEAAGDSIEITPAPMGYFIRSDRAMMDWLPSIEGFQQVRHVLREVLANLVNA